jgi:hypothetical protein
MAQNPFQGQDPNQPGTLGNPPSSLNPQPPYAQPDPQGYYPPQTPTSNPQQYAQSQPGPQGYYPPQAPTSNPQQYAQSPYAQPQPGQQGYYPPQIPMGNQQPYAQMPYAQPQKVKLIPGYLIAGIAGVIGFIAVFMPYFTFSETSYYTSISVPGSEVGGGLAFFDIVLALAAALVAAFILFGPSLLNSATAQANNLVKSLNTQVRTWIIALIAIGGAGALFHIIFMLTNGSSLYGVGVYENGYSVSWGFGAILYLLTMLAVVGGGIWELTKHKQ